MNTSLHSLCLAIARTYITDKDSIDGNTLASIAKKLIDAESQPGGPYKNAQGECDILTNLAVGYLFIVLGKPLPAVTTFIREHRDEAAKIPAAKKLLGQYDKLLNAAAHQAAPVVTNPIYINVRSQLQQLPQPLRKQTLSFLQRVQRADVDQEICHIATFFSQSELTPSSTLSLNQLGEANVYCWIAYMIYDHIMDGELPTHLIPVANTAARTMLQYYQSLFPRSHPFQARLQAVVLSMDEANAWETQTCRYRIKDTEITITSIPRYQHRYLAARSYGHVLGPLALMFENTYTAAQHELVEKGFYHYLIARQLNDDLHDWQDDLRAGQASVVVARLLTDSDVTPGTYAIDTLITRLQHTFWTQSMESINVLIHRHVRASIRCFQKSGVVKQPSPLLHLIHRQRQIALDSTYEHSRYQDFIATYQQLS